MYKGLYNRYFKRLFDFVLALLLLVLAIPFYFFIGLAIFLDDGFPIFYRPFRGGFRGKPFRIFKFRTMVKDADKIGGGTTALHDSRITFVGGFLRKTKLDETANLINILLGSMSFIGPRPELLKYTGQYKGKERSILQVRPGVTDFSSLEFINLDEIVGEGKADEVYERVVLPRKNALRIKYAQTVSLGTDLEIFFRTVGKVIGKSFDYIFRRKHR